MLQRPALERDVRESLEATAMEWEERLQAELGRVQDVWFAAAEARLEDVAAASGGGAGEGDGPALADRRKEEG